MRLQNGGGIRDTEEYRASAAMGDIEMIADAMVESHPWRRPTGKYGLFVNWGLELPGRGPGGGANIRTMVSDPDKAPDTLGEYATTRPTAEDVWARNYPIDAATTAEDMWRTGGYGEGDERESPYGDLSRLPDWLYPTSDAPSFTGDLGVYTPTSEEQEEVMGFYGSSTDRTLFHEAFHRGATQVGAFVGRQLLEEEDEVAKEFLRTEFRAGRYDSKESDSPRLRQLQEEKDLLWEIRFDQEKYLDALDTLEGRGASFKKLKELSQKHAKEVEEGIEDGPAYEASTKAQAKVQETLDELERAQNIALRYLPRYRGEALGLNAGGSVDDEAERFELGIDWKDPVDEDWPKKDRDYYEIRGQMVWPGEIEDVLKRIAEEEEDTYGPVSKSHKEIDEVIAEEGILGALKRFNKVEAIQPFKDLIDEQLAQDEDLLSDLQLENTGRIVTERDVMNVMTQQGLTVEEAMRFLSEMSSDSSRSWEDMLESFLASLREESS